MPITTLIFTLTSVLSMLTALAAFVISYRIFVRQKTFENENHFFVYKLEQYNKIIRKAVDLHELYYDAMIYFKTVKEQRQPDYADFHAKAEEVETHTAAFRLALTKHSLFLPKDILERLNAYYEKLLDEDEKLDEDEQTLESLERGMARLDKLEEELQEIINMARADLGIETIDERLKKRIGKIKTAPRA